MIELSLSPSSYTLAILSNLPQPKVPTCVENILWQKIIISPEFCETRFVPEILVRTFHSPTSRYDIIIGRDILRLGFMLDHARKTVSWDGLSIPMAVPGPVPVPPSSRQKPITHYTCAQISVRHNAYAVSKSPIKDAKYELITSEQVADNSIHLTTTLKQYLIALLQNLFSGKLGRYNKGKFTLELQNTSTKPIFCKPYPVVQVHTEV